MERWAGRVAIVTGASAGIGAAIVMRLVKHGMKVIGCARNVAAIEELNTSLADEKGKLIAMKCDVSKEDDVLAVIARATEEWGGVDVCINNAGLAHAAPLLSGDTDSWRNMMEVNVLGLAVFTREAFKSMKAKGIDDGHIINLNSLSGHRVIPSPRTHFYAASKFAVTAMTEGVRNELRQLKSRIRVSQVSPGLVSTEFAGRMGNENSQEFYASNAHLLDEDVVDAVIFQLSRPAHVQVHDLLIRATDQTS